MLRFGRRKPRVLTDFFERPALAWLTGGLLLFGGLLIIANHQYWSSLAAVLISLFGWFLALRGLVLLIAPQWIESAAWAAMTMMPVVRIGFGFLALCGVWLSYVGWVAGPPRRAVKGGAPKTRRVPSAARAAL